MSEPPLDMNELIDDLQFGARAGDMEELSAALAAGAPVDGRDANGTTALMMAAANGHLDAMQALLGAGADINATNNRKNTCMHWAVFTAQEEAVKALLAAGGCDLLLKNEQGCTAAMDAERAGKGELVVLLLNALDEDAAAASLGIEEEEAAAEDEELQRAQQPGVDKTLDGHELKTWQEAPAGGGEALPATRGVLSGETLGGKGGGGAVTTAAAPAAGAPLAAAAAQQQQRRMGFLEAAAARAADAAALRAEAHRSDSETALVTRERPVPQPEIARRVEASRGQRTGDWRYSVMPAVVPPSKMLQFSRDFFRTTELLDKEGNTFGPEFEQQYTGHRNYFYFMNRNRVVPGAESAAFIFEELDGYTRQVVELHHPGAAVRLERAFGAYYEGGRDGFHLGVNEHCDGDANLVSTVVHAALPDGDVGFTEGGELTVSEVDEYPARAIVHSNATVGSVVYLGASIFHHATPIKLGGRRLVFCMFYACEQGGDLSRHALA